MNMGPCTICGRSREELASLGTCLVDVVPRFPDVAVQIVCLPCLNAAFWLQRQSTTAVEQITHEATASSLVAELLRNGILDAQTLADHFGVGEVDDMQTRFRQDGVIHFTFTKEPA